MNEQIRYAGFWIRVVAALIDTALMLAITLPLLFAIYGRGYFDSGATQLVAGPADFLITWVAPAVAVVLFWIHRSATPGKMIVHVKVVDARSGQPLSVGQSIGRYLGYYVSIIALGLGLVWVAFDERKQGWHDKLAGTIVVRTHRNAR